MPEWEIPWEPYARNSVMVSDKLNHLILLEYVLERNRMSAFHPTSERMVASRITFQMLLGEGENLGGGGGGS